MNTLILILMFNTASTQFNLPPNLLASVCYVETKHDVTLVHENDGPSHSYGVCQIKLETAKWLGFKGTAQELMKPEVNIHYAAKYLSYTIKRYNDVTRGIVAYNKGNAKGLTRSNYSDKVINIWEANKWQNQQALNTTQENPILVYSVLSP